ncbi:MAG: DUF1206 domain-containing protein [Actinomycetota bacterium]|nr:DUF1206 domain-containing protein [Actinomycetota bacterium]
MGQGLDPSLIGRSQGESVASSPWFERGARAGLVARGAVYIIIGVLAVKLAIGEGGETTSQQQALQEIAQQSFGKTLLVLTAIGLAGYAIWRLVRAWIGHGPEQSDSTFDRIGGFVSGIGYLLLCIAAIEIIIGSGGGGGSEQASKTTGGVLGWTGGVYIVGIAGAATIFEGLDQGYKAITRKFLEKSKTGEMSPTMKTTFTRIGVFGHLARMVVFVLIGYFLLKAAIDFNPDAAISLDGALSKLAQADYGPYLLGVVAFGLIGFGLYSLLDARYRKV